MWLQREEKTHMYVSKLTMAIAGLAMASLGYMATCSTCLLFAVSDHHKHLPRAMVCFDRAGKPTIGMEWGGECVLVKYHMPKN
jgi:hypothetical protein